MGELRNRLERRGKSWLGYTGHQVAALLQIWAHAKGQIDCPVAGEPAWWQSAKSLVRKGVIHRISYERSKVTHDGRTQASGYALTPKGWNLCQRIRIAFPLEAVEADTEAATYFRNKETT